MQQILDDVRELLEDEEAKGSSRLPGLTELLNTPEGLPRCRTELETLKAKLEIKDGTIQALVWPLKEGDVKKTIDYLGWFQHLLISGLNVDQTYVPPISLFRLDSTAFTDG